MRSTDTVQKFGAPMSLWDKTGTLRLRNAALTNSVMQALYYRLLANNEHCLCEKRRVASTLGKPGLISPVSTSSGTCRGGMS